jgi:hypothetical protein
LARYALPPRPVRQGRDGVLYLLTDSGRMVQVRD